METINKIIGQNLAKSQISGLFTSLEHDVRCLKRPRIIYGPSGTGKTHMINALCRDLEDKHDAYVHRVDDCDAIMLQSSPATIQLCSAINASQTCLTVCVLDESQKIFRGSKNKSAMERDLCQYVFPHGDEVRDVIGGKIAGREVVANFRNLILILATNEKDSMETSESRKKGEAPFARRFSGIELGLYTQEEMNAIIPSYFASKGYRINEDAANMVSRLHRGNMEALCAVMERIKERVYKPTVNKAEIIEACRLTDFLPRGVRRAEGRLLSALCHGNLSRTRAEGVSGIFGKQFISSFNHLSLNQWSNDDKGDKIQTPLVASVGNGSGVAITQFGKDYILKAEKSGFTVA